MLKVIIAGGRDFSDYHLLKIECDRLLSNVLPDVEVVSGKARGADTLGEVYAKEKGLLVKEFPADWKRLGKKAGYIRNAQMADYADAVIAFWDGESRGTKHMIEIAREAGLNVKVVRYGKRDTGYE